MPASEGDQLGIMSLGGVMQNMWLTAESVGLGLQIMSVFSSEEVEDELRCLLSIPQHMRIRALSSEARFSGGNAPHKSLCSSPLKGVVSSTPGAGHGVLLLEARYRWPAGGGTTMEVSLISLLWILSRLSLVMLTAACCRWMTTSGILSVVISTAWRGSVLVRRGKRDKGRDLGMDQRGAAASHLLARDPGRPRPLPAISPRISSRRTMPTD